MCMSISICVVGGYVYVFTDCNCICIDKAGEKKGGVKIVGVKNVRLKIRP